MNGPDAYGSHAAVLAGMMAYIADTDGGVLELGAGWYSTPLLHAICAAQRRPLFTVESDTQWLTKFHPYRTEMHELLGRDTVKVDETLDGRWDLILVDQAPNSDRLLWLNSILACDRQPRFVIVHDMSPKNQSARRRTCARFEYTRLVRSMDPWTAVCSNVEPIPELIP